MAPENRRWMVFRPNTRPLAALPLNVRSVGGSVVNPSWKEKAMVKWFSQLFWIAEGRLEFLQENGWKAAQAGEVFIYLPGSQHHFRVLSAARFFWVTFDHKDSARWLAGFGLAESTHTAGPCPEALFLRLKQVLANGTQEGERQAAHLAHELLLTIPAHTPRHEHASLATQARSLLDDHFCESNFGIAHLVEELKIHRSTLFRAFRLHYGLSPSRYLQNLRRQHALALLQSTNLPISDIAQRSGFSDPNYFSRTIREAVGMSPREFRSR